MTQVSVLKIIAELAVDLSLLEIQRADQPSGMVNSEFACAQTVLEITDQGRAAVIIGVPQDLPVKQTVAAHAGHSKFVNLMVIETRAGDGLAVLIKMDVHLAVVAVFQETFDPDAALLVKHP